MANVHKLLSNTVSQRGVRAVIGTKTYNKAHFLGTGLVDAATPTPPPAVVPMPDEEQLKVAARRRATRPRAGRASTILTSGDGQGQSDRLGP